MDFRWSLVPQWVADSTGQRHILRTKRRLKVVDDDFWDGSIAAISPLGGFMAAIERSTELNQGCAWIARIAAIGQELNLAGVMQ